MSRKTLIHAWLAAALALGALTASPAHAGLFGESDEEKAARLREDNQDASILSLNQRVHDLEETLSRLTGQNETLTHRIQDLDVKLDRQKKDFEYRLCAIAAQQLGAGTGDDQTSLPCPGGTGTAAPSQQQSGSSSSSEVIHLSPPPGVLGTLPANRPASAPAMQTLGDFNTRAQFDAALNLLAKARYDDARAAFRNFADTYPDDELTPQAVYWVGDIAFVQKDYSGAAHAFVEQIKKYPTSARGPDSMLKLGQSLIALDQTKEGCMTLAALATKYPDASKTVTAQAAGVRKASCIEAVDALTEMFAGAMARLAPPWPGAVAVSGGGDSLALMHLLREWCAGQGFAPPVVLTVDHGLQPGSAANAQRVLRWAKDVGLKAHALAWKGAKPGSDIEAAARAARYGLMGRWCKAHGVDALYVGHTLDDQAETFLLRLARGSGLDGLAAMRPIAPFPVEGFSDVRLVRPLIGLDRAALRAHLAARGRDWIEDPMNADPRFGRVRIREALVSLAAAGLTKSRIADAAAHLGRAREALDAVTAAVLLRACRAEGTAILVDTAALRAAPREVGLRALARLLMAVSGQAYRPRFERLERLFDSLDRIGAGRTLHGCRIAPSRAGFGPTTLVISRENRRVEAKTGHASGRGGGKKGPAIGP